MSIKSRRGGLPVSLAPKHAYPCLMVTRSGRTIVLMSDPSTGVVLYSDPSPQEDRTALMVGYYSEQWSHLVDYVGTITLTNDA